MTNTVLDLYFLYNGKVTEGKLSKSEADGRYIFAKEQFYIIFDLKLNLIELCLVNKKDILTTYLELDINFIFNGMYDFISILQASDSIAQIKLFLFTFGQNHDHLRTIYNHLVKDDISQLI